MSTGPGLFGWLVVATMIVMAMGMVVATLVHFGSNPIGLTLICLVAAYLIWDWIKDRLDQRR